MSDGRHQVSLLRRVVGEHRRIVWPLAIALVLNVVVFAFLVYPLSQRVANIEQRDRQAEQALAAARLDHAQASGTVTGKDRAAMELDTFYNRVLPQDLAGARRLTHLRIWQLARESNLERHRVSTEPERTRESDLTRLKIQMELAGNYSDIRTFVYKLESAPEFVVVDNVELTEGAESGEPLQVKLELSTYYRDSAR